MVRRPPTDAAFPPIPMYTEHGYVAAVSRFLVGTLFAYYAADGDVRTVIRVSLWSVQRTFARRVRHDNDMVSGTRLTRKERCGLGRGKPFSGKRGERRRVPLVQEVSVGVDDIGLGEFVFDERDDVGEVGLSGVLTIGDRGHGGREKERGRYQEGCFIYSYLCITMV